MSPTGLAQGQPKGQPCVDHGPCITNIFQDYNDQNEPFLEVDWDGRGTWDHYYVKYSRPGKESPPYRMEGNINSVQLGKVHRNTTYTFKVQACGINLTEWARGVPVVECGGWAEASKTTAIRLENPVLVPAEP